MKGGRFSTQFLRDKAIAWTQDEKKNWSVIQTPKHLDLTVEAKFGRNGDAHQHQHDHSFWIRWNPETQSWTRLVGVMPDFNRDLTLREFGEAGAVEVRKDGEKDDRFRIAEFDGEDSVRNQDYGQLLPPSEVFDHTGTYVVFANGQAWNPGMPFPMEAESVSRKRPAETKPVEKKKRAKKEKLVSLTVRIIRNEETITEVREFSKTGLLAFVSDRERFPDKKTQFEVWTKDAWEPIAKRTSVPKAVFDLSKNEDNLTLRATIKSKGTKQSVRTLGRGTVTFIHKITGEALEPMELTSEEGLPENIFPESTRFWRGKSKSTDVKEAEAPLVKVELKRVADTAVAGFSTLLYLPPVRVLKARTGGLYYDSISQLRRFDTFKDISYKKIFRSINNELLPITNDEDYKALFLASGNARPELLSMFSFSSFDSTSSVAVPYLWVQDDVEMQDPTIPAPGKLPAMKMDTSKHTGAKRKKTTPNEISEYSSGISASARAIDKKFKEHSAGIANQSVQNILSGTESVAEAIQQAARTETRYLSSSDSEALTRMALSDPALAAAVTLAASARSGESTPSVSVLIESTPDPENTRRELAKFSGSAGDEVAMETTSEDWVLAHVRRQGLVDYTPLGAPGSTGITFYSPSDPGYAIKIVDIRTEEYKAMLKREVYMLRTLHKLHTSLHGLPQISPELVITTEDERSDVGIIVMERIEMHKTIAGKKTANSTLWDIITTAFDPDTFEGNNLENDVRARYIAIRGLVRATLSILDILRTRLILHGDVRPSNVAFMRRGERFDPVLIDWGLGIFYDQKTLKASDSTPALEGRPDTFDAVYDAVTFIATAHALTEGRMITFTSHHRGDLGIVERAMADFPFPRGDLDLSEVMRLWNDYMTPAFTTNENAMIHSVFEDVTALLRAYGIYEEGSKTTNQDGRDAAALAYMRSPQWNQKKLIAAGLVYDNISEWVEEMGTSTSFVLPAGVFLHEEIIAYVSTVLCLELAYIRFLTEAEQYKLDKMQASAENENLSEEEETQQFENILKHARLLETVLGDIFDISLPPILVMRFSQLIFRHFPKTQHSIGFELSDTEEGEQLFIILYDSSLGRLAITDYAYTSIFAQEDDLSTRGSEGHARSLPTSLEEKVEDNGDETMEEKEESMEVSAQEEAEDEESEDEEEAHEVQSAGEEEENEPEQEVVEVDGELILYILGNRTLELDTKLARRLEVDPSLQSELTSVILVELLDTEEALDLSRLDIETMHTKVALPLVAKMNVLFSSELEKFQGKEEIETQFWISEPENSPSVNAMISKYLPAMYSSVIAASELPREKPEISLQKLQTWINVATDVRGKGHSVSDALIQAVRSSIVPEPGRPRKDILGAIGRWYYDSARKKPKSLVRAGLVPLTMREELGIEGDVRPAAKESRALAEWQRNFGFDLFLVSRYAERLNLATAVRGGMDDSTERAKTVAYLLDYVEEDPLRKLPEYARELFEEIENALRFDKDLAREVKEMFSFGAFPKTPIDLASKIAELRSHGLVRSVKEERPVDEKKPGEGVVSITKKILTWETNDSRGNVREKVLRALGLWTPFDTVFEEVRKLASESVYRAAIIEGDEEVELPEPSAWADPRPPPPGILYLLKRLGLQEIPPFAFDAPPTIELRRRRNTRTSKGKELATLPFMISATTAKAMIDAAYTYEQGSILATGLQQFAQAQVQTIDVLEEEGLRDEDSEDEEFVAEHHSEHEDDEEEDEDFAEMHTDDEDDEEMEEGDEDSE